MENNELAILSEEARGIKSSPETFELGYLVVDGVSL